MASRNIERVDLSSALGSGSRLGYGNYTAWESRVINVLLVGRSQSGKTTIIETLKNPQSGASSKGFSDTKEASMHTMTLSDDKRRVLYHLNIIDTPGLKEIREQIEESRSDEEILKVAQRCIEKHITALNVVCFVSVAGKTHALDIEVFDTVISFLGEEVRENSLMILTHCESYSEEMLKEFVTDIKAHGKSRKVYEYCKLGVYFYGAVDIQKDIASLEESPGRLQKFFYWMFPQWKTSNAVISLRLKKTERMRDRLLECFIQNASKPKPVKLLQSIQQEAEDAQKQAIEKAIRQKVTDEIMPKLATMEQQLGETKSQLEKAESDRKVALDETSRLIQRLDEERQAAQLEIDKRQQTIMGLQQDNAERERLRKEQVEARQLQQQREDELARLKLQNEEKQRQLEAERNINQQKIRQQEQQIAMQRAALSDKPEKKGGCSIQ